MLVWITTKVIPLRSFLVAHFYPTTVFNNYINDLPLFIHNKIKLYVYYRSTSIADYISLQQDLYQIVQWANAIMEDDIQHPEM